jgi:hypothetical protein
VKRLLLSFHSGQSGSDSHELADEIDEMGIEELGAATDTISPQFENVTTAVPGYVS